MCIRDRLTSSRVLWAGAAAGWAHSSRAHNVQTGASIQGSGLAWAALCRALWLPFAQHVPAALCHDPGLVLLIAATAFLPLVAGLAQIAASILLQLLCRVLQGFPKASAGGHSPEQGRDMCVCPHM